MNESPLEPLDADLEALLRAERGAEPPGEALDRVWSRLGSGVPSVGSGTGPRPSWLASHAAAVAGAAFVVGGATGAGVYAATVQPPAARIVYVDRVVPSPQVAPTPWSPVAPPVAAPPEPVAPRASAPAPPSESLAVERAFLDNARSHIASGDAAGALALLDDHGRRFRKPQLSEEREALAIQSLVSLARYDEARARAARFRQASPNSLFVPAIDAAIGAIP